MRSLHAIPVSVSLLPACLLSLLLAACGGGGGSSSSQPGAPSGLTYGQSSFTVLLGTPIDPLVPKVQGPVDTWSIDPAPPPGLAFDTATGILSGSPTETVEATSHTVLAENTDGTDSTAFELRVARPVQRAYVPGADGSLSVHVVDARGGTTFHHGFALDPAAASVAEQPAVHPTAPWVLVPNLGDAVNPSNLSVYEVLDDGRLEAGAPVSIGVGPHRSRMRSDGAAAYVTCAGSDQLFAFEVDPLTGSLTPFAGTPVPLAGGPLHLAVDPGDAFLYVANVDAESISVVPLDPTTGALLGSGSQFSLNGQASAVAVTPGGRLLLVTLPSFDLVVAMAIDQGTGVLTTVGSASTGSEPVALAVAPTGTHVLVAGGGDGTLSTFALDTATGTLTPETTLPLDVTPTAVRIEDSGFHAHVAGGGAGEPAELVTLSLQDPAAPEVIGRRSSRSTPTGLALGHGPRPVGPRARGLYALNRADATVNVFQVDPADGALTELGPPVLVGGAPSDLAVDPFGRFLWVSSADEDGIRTFSIDEETGDLTAEGAPEPTDADPAGLAVGPAGRVLYVTSETAERVTSFAIDPDDGTPTPVDAALVGEEPGAVSVDPTGRFVVTADRGIAELSVLPVGPDGQFTGVAQTVSAPGNPSGLHWNPAGTHLFVALTKADHVVPYRLDAAAETLVLQAPGASAKNKPRHMVPGPGGQRAYACLGGPGDGGLRVFSLDDEGNPTGLGTLTGVGLEPFDLVVDPAGGFVFTANREGDDVSRFELDGSGDAAFLDLTPAGDEPSALGLLRRVQ